MQASPEQTLIELGGSMPTIPLILWASEQLRLSAGREQALRRFSIDGPKLKELSQLQLGLRKIVADVQELAPALPAGDPAVDRILQEISQLGCPPLPAEALSRAISLMSPETARGTAVQVQRDLHLKKGLLYKGISSLARALRQLVVEAAPASSPRLSAAA